MEGITSEARLISIALNDSLEGVRLAAIERLDHQGTLAVVSRSDESWEVRIAAVHKLTDQAILVEVATKDTHSRVRSAAVHKLTDQAVLAQVATKDSDEQVRENAVHKLTDQAILVEVATKDTHSRVRSAAVHKLTDQAVLAQVATKDSDEQVRENAVKKLTDQTILAEIAMGMYGSASVSAMCGLRDQVLLAKVAKKAEICNVRLKAVEKLSDKATLAEVAKNDTYKHVRIAAARRLVDETTVKSLCLAKDVPALVSIIKTHPDWSVRRAAVNALHTLDLSWEEDKLGEAWYAVLSNDWTRVLKLGSTALEPLVSTLRINIDEVMHAERGLVDCPLSEEGLMTLAKIGGAAVVPLLLEVVQESNENCQSHADCGVVDALVSIGSSAVDALIGVVIEKPEYWENYWKQHFAICALGRIRDTRAVGPLCALLGTDTSEWQRYRAAIALGEIGDSRAVNALTAALSDPHDYVRREAAAALSKIRPSGL